jgi:hypothetical protein
MLTATPTNWLRRSYLIEEDDKLVADVDGAMLVERATATVGSAKYALYRETLFSGTYVLERGTHVVARAYRRSMFRTSFDVVWGDKTLALRKLSIWRPTYGVFENDEQIGTVKPVGFLSQRGTLDGASSLSLEIRVFLLWIALMMWKRNQQYAPG